MLELIAIINPSTLLHVTSGLINASNASHPFGLNNNNKKNFT